MPAIDDITFSLLEKEFSKLNRGLKLQILTGPNCNLCDSLRQFGRKIGEASKGQIVVEETRVAEGYPGVRILDNLTYWGFPMGKQMWVLVNYLVDLSNARYIMDNEVRVAVMAINEPVDIDVFVMANCDYSPPQVRWAYELAALNDKIRVRIIDVTFFPELATRYDISATPMTNINNRLRIRGAAQPDELLRKIRDSLK
jgi:alkyl hydroperoxide reductase subunit AhpF